VIYLQVVDEELPRQSAEPLRAYRELATQAEIPVLLFVAPREREDVKRIGESRLESSSDP
jgi:hypothetical protein